MTVVEWQRMSLVMPEQGYGPFYTSKMQPLLKFRPCGISQQRDGLVQRDKFSNADITTICLEEGDIM